MLHVFKAINDLRKVKTKDEELKHQIIFVIRSLRAIARMTIGDAPYFLTERELEREEEDFWRFRDKDRYRKPMFRRAKNGRIMNINGGFYVSSIKKALAEGNPAYLKEKKLYYEVDGKYYHKNEYILYNGSLYNSSEYELKDGKLIDKTLIGELYEYDNKRRESIYEKYYLDKKPIPVDRLCNNLITSNTEALITIYLDAQSNSWPLSNCFKYRDDILCRGNNSVHFADKWVSSYKICFPIEEIGNIKYEVPQAIRDGFERLKNKLKDKTGLR